MGLESMKGQTKDQVSLFGEFAVMHCLVGLVSESLSFFVGSLAPNRQAAEPIATLSILPLMIFGGLL